MKYLYIKKITAAAVAGCALLSGGAFISGEAQAEGFFAPGPSVFSYDYADIAYRDVEDFDGFGLRFSADFKDNFAFKGQYEKLSFDSRFTDVDADILSAGVVYHKQAANYPQADFNLEAAFQSISAGRADDTGLLLAAGVRYAASEVLELNGSIGITTAGDTDIAIDLRALYEFSDTISGFVETTIADDTAFGLGVRVYWKALKGAS